MNGWLRCLLLRPRLAPFVRGELDRQAAVQMRRHLSSCPACRRRASRWLQSTRAMERVAVAGAPGVDDAFFARLFADTMARIPVQDGARAARGLRSRPARWGLVAAAAVMFALGFAFTGAVVPGAMPSPGGARTHGRPGGPASDVSAGIRRLGDERPVRAEPGLGTLERADMPAIPLAPAEVVLPMVPIPRRWPGDPIVGVPDDAKPSRR